MDYGAKLSKSDGELLSDSTPYQRIIEKLLYLSNTRPDISFAIGKLSQFLDCPTTEHLRAAHQILRYMKGSPAAGLFFSAKSDLNLTGFSDSDWVGCLDSRRSISAYCFYLGSSLVSWKSKKQLTVAASSFEVEYRALALATREVQWLSYVLQELGVPLQKATNIYCDSKSAVYIATNPIFHERTKHRSGLPHCLRQTTRRRD
ncbi:secreted RxLR effector protein 161-like [Arachis duranensis]|uniref:Secreted RxLR effector protein 161-like n=1 Tax=Arachis duranensis TaxID=130453 RepID=A0A6P4BFX4_ARADU|nr:secreted RxLR effector protein 161-like [Arachis duranensis]